MKKIKVLLIVLVSVFSLKAQVVNVCGTDTIVLQVENYDGKGVIEWQESIDSVNWVTIPEMVGEIYRFFPTQAKYYRAVVKTSTCDALYSAFSFVQLPPVANAGTDKKVGGKSTILLGSQLLGATGEWTVLAGDSGIIAEPNNPYSQFSGKYNVPYKLKWTVTNGCGQSSDTVMVQFEEIVVNNNYIVVDNTDSLYSDSTEMATGLYRIKFSDPAINPSDSVLLLGVRDSISFLRKVISFTYIDSVYNFVTEQGRLIDLFISGSLNIGDAINESIIKGSNGSQSSRVKAMNTFPLRQDIINNINNNGIIVINIDQSPTNKVLALSDNASENRTLYLSFPSRELKFANDQIKFKLENLDFSLTPNFELSFDRRPFELRFGLDNAVFTKYLKWKIEANATVDNFFKENETIGTPIEKGFLISGVPVTLNFAIKAKFDMKMEAGLSVERTDNYSNTFTAIVKASSPFSSDFIHNSKENSTTSIATSLNGGFKTEFKIGPEVSFKIFDVLGPYFSLPLQMEVNMKTNTNLNWQGSAGIGFEGNIGVKAEIDPVKMLSVTLYDGCVPFDFKHDFFGDKNISEYKWPARLELVSGDLQQAKANTKLSKPVIFKVVSTNGTGVPLVPVRVGLGTGNGTVNKSLEYTDMSGQVSFDWTVGAKSTNILEVYVLDYENIDIEGSPIYVTAYSSSGATTCENSNLAITIKTATSYKYPIASGGTSPYTYSKNGIDYSSTIPQYDLLSYGNYTVYVKDKNGCVRSKSFTLTAPNACTGTDLTMDIVTTSNSVAVTGKKGTAPYVYAIENETNYTSNNLFSNLIAGYHTVYIKDAKGCVITSEVKIDTNTTPAIKALYPAPGAGYVYLTKILFQWSAATYATNQVYDLYLKKGTDAYTLVASNLSSTSYLYTSTLLANTGYTWKIAVKSGGTVLDAAEFGFTTATGLTTTPVVPVLLTPADGSVNNIPYVTLSWQAQAGDFVYDVYLDTKNATTLLATNISTSSYTFGQMGNHVYYWKVKIKNRVTGENKTSTVQSFTLNSTSKYGTVTDIDGNVYHTITIGTQVWMVENLKTTRYRNGDAIGTTTASIPNDATSKYQWAYNDNENNVAKYGRLYTWWAATDTRNIAPAGWHVPTDSEWTTLENYLIANGYNYDGTTTGNKIAKSLASTTDWFNYSTIGSIGNDLTKNNSSGFTALPGGYRSSGGTFYDFGYDGNWWSSTEYYATNAWNRHLVYNYAVLYRLYSNKYSGFSVRCIRD